MTSDSISISVTLVLVFAGLVYTQGWYRLRSSCPNLMPAWRLAVFMAGLLSAWIAIGSPLADLDHELLSIHMVQHLLLMAVGPPLILLGAPLVSLQYGLSARFGSRVLGPFPGRSAVRAVGHAMAHPMVGWLAGTVTVIGWHVPAAFELGMRSHLLHEIQRATFLAGGFLFWWPVIEPWPKSAKGARLFVPLYLFLGTLPCDALSAFLTFCDRVVYQSYLSRPRLFDISPLQDQEFAGALMWICVTLIYLVPSAAVTIRILSSSTSDTSLAACGLARSSSILRASRD